ncbi:Cadherin domain protein [Paragonimus heterotremus]|uniref:Cadherin domain protein n=1 Tax=Paragonimus heterotremus TaxID=100268 RepID=A0A8J4WHY1_9TREM|nr:Cadherin domain protein [Paragonimus heterotremus]
MPATVDCDYMFSWSADALIVISGSFSSPFLVNALSGPKDTISDTVTVTFVLVEESRISTKIGNIYAKMNTVPGVASSMNIVDKKPFLEFKPNKYIALNGTSGDLYVRSRIDRESLCSEVGTCCVTTTSLGTETSFTPNVQFGSMSSADMMLGHASCALRMLVLQSPANSQFVEIIVHILDLNDNAPVWSSKVLDVEIPEHVSIGHSVKLPEAIDTDQGPFNTVVAYKLFDAEYSSETEQILCNNCLSYDDASNNIFGGSVSRRISPFKLDSQMMHSPTVGPLKFDLKLRVEGEIDREKQATYFFILYAIDGQDEYHLHKNWLKSSEYLDQVSTNSVKHTGTLTVKVNVLDINDHEPAFIDPQPMVTIAENTKPGTVIYQAVARDTDISDQRKLTYHISSSASPEVLRCFQIDPISGEVKIKDSLNRYNATLVPSNDISFDPSSQTGEANFLRKPTIGYLIPLQVTDRIHKGTAILRVQLTQVNLHAPKIHIASHLKMSPAGDQLWVLENTKSDSVLAIITIEDPDKPIQQAVQEYPSQHSTRPECFTSQDYFSIRPLLIRATDEFKLILTHPLDREKRESYPIKIECWDSGSPPLSSEINLLVHVEDVDDSIPIFEKSIYLASVKEDQPPNTLVMRVHATDADVGKNAVIFYHIVHQTYTFVSARTDGRDQEPSLSEERPMLTINPKTGEIYTEVILDRETVSLINCTVEACGNFCSENMMLAGDGVGETIRTQTQVIVTVEDVNDCKPQFNSTSYEFAIVEGQPPHTQVR